jgi:hypothetical protein
MKITLVSLLVLAVVVSLMQQIHAALDPPSNILKDYIDAKIEAVTENNLNRIFSRMDENTRELLRKIEDVITKIDSTSKDLNAKIDSTSKDLNAKIDSTSKDLNAKIDNISTKLDRIYVEFQAGKLAFTIVAAFLGLLAASNFGVFLKQVVQPFFTK